MAGSSCGRALHYLYERCVSCVLPDGRTDRTALSGMRHEQKPVFLMTGRIEESIWMHPMGIPIVCLILYFLWNRYIFGRNAKGMKVLIITAIVLLVALYCIRMPLFFPNRAPYVYMEDNILAQILPSYKQILHAIGLL